MMVSLFDVVLLIAWAGFVFYGLFFGLIKMIGDFFGFIIGVFLASRFYLVAFEYVGGFFGSYEALGKIIVFLLLVSIFTKVISFGFVIVEKIFNIASIIPFLKTFNRLGGAILGFVLGGLLLGIVLYLATKHAMFGSLMASLLANSKIAPILIVVGKILLPLIPPAIKKMQSVVEAYT